MKIMVQFIGAEGSLGYRRGAVHVGEILGNVFVPLDREGGICPYGSVEAFLKNWLILDARTEVDHTDPREIVP